MARNAPAQRASPARGRVAPSYTRTHRSTRPPMPAYLLRRLWQMIPTLAGVVLLVFVLFKFFGGDPAEIVAGLNASP